MTKDQIILINLPPASGYSYANRGAIYPSTGTMLLGTMLKQHGYDVQLIDAAYHEDYLNKLQNSITLSKDRIIYVGMTVMTTQIPFALASSKIVKECNSDIPVVWGGPHPTLFPQQTVIHPNVDIVAINEGTLTAVQLADSLKNSNDLKHINGIGFKNGDGIVTTSPAELDDIRDLPHFDFSLIEESKYLNPRSHSVYQREFPGFPAKVRMMPILTGLGCPYKCTFCINPILKRRYRYRSAESIISEIKRLQASYDVNTFLFLDEDFFVNKNRVHEFVTLAENEELHFNWRVWCRVDHFKNEYINTKLVERFTNIGFGSMAMGGESANPEVLDSLKKGTTPDQIMNSLNQLTATKVFPRYSFMVGLENESMEQIKNTYRFCFNMTSINPEVDIAGPFIFRLYPGSEIYDRLTTNYGLSVPDDLESWVDHLHEEDNFIDMPWTPKAFQRKTQLLTFYSGYALGSYPRKGRSVRLIYRRLLRRFSRFRLKHFIFWFPFEYWAHRILSRIYHLMKRK